MKIVESLVVVKFLFRNTFWSLLSHVFARGSLMLTSIILARNFSTESFAAYGYFVMTISMLGTYASLGLGVAASLFFAGIGVDTQKPPPRVGALWTISIALAITIFVIVVMIPASWLQLSSEIPQWLFALGAAITVMSVVPSGAILGLEYYRPASVISMLTALFLICGIGVATFLQSIFIASTIVISSVLLQLLGEAIVVLRRIGLRKFSEGFYLCKSDLLGILHFAGPMFLVSLLSASGSWLLGNIILQDGGGGRAFALFVIGLQWFSLGLLIPGMLSRVVLPIMVKKRANEKSASINDLVLKSVIISMASAALMTVVVIVFGPSIMSLYGTNYVMDPWFLAAFVGAAVFSAPANILGNLIVANDGQRSWLLLTVIWLTILLCCGYLFVGLGPISGAFSLAIAAAVLTLLTFNLAKNRRLI